MKINILIMTWINRILMIPFLISLLIAIVDPSFLFYSIYIAFAIGCFQVLSSLIAIFYFKKIKNFKLILIYMISVILYFVSIFLFFEFERQIINKDIIFIIFWTIPIPLSLFWTYILEYLKIEI